MPKTQKSEIANPTQAVIKTIITVAIVLFVVFGWLWWRFVYTSPKNVFWGMINNNLATYSITKQTNLNQNAESLNQTTQINLGAQDAVESRVVLTQDDGQNKSEVTTENIGFIDSDYSRYIKINTNQKNAAGQAPDFSKVLGVWGKSGNTKDQQSTQYFRQSLTGVIPIANLNPEQRARILSLMHEKNVYSPNYGKVKKETVDGHSAYVFEVDLNLKPYVEVLQEVAKVSGLEKIEGLDAEQYNGAPPVKLTVTVGKVSHQLMQIKFEGNGREENYRSFGLARPIEVPQGAISLPELQQRVQSIQ